MVPIYMIQVDTQEFLEKYELSKELYQKTLGVAVRAEGNGKLVVAYRSSRKRNNAYNIWKKYFESVSVDFRKHEAEEEWLGQEGVLKKEK